MKPLPSVEAIREEFDYDPLTGRFKDSYPKKGRKRFDGFAGSVGPNKYVYLRIKGARYLAHRVAWKLLTGFDPVREIDHRDTDRQNNRASNLREATSQEQSWNTSLSQRNTSGHKGVSFNKRKRRWQVRMRDADRQLCVGYFVSLDRFEQQGSVRPCQIN